MAWRYLFHSSVIIFLPVAVVSQVPQTPRLETISIASKQFVIDPADIVLGSTTISAGGPAVTVNGAIVSEDSNDDLFVDGVEVLTGPTSSIRTRVSSLSQSISPNASFSASTGPSCVTATTSSGRLLNATSSNVSVSDSTTVSNEAMASSALSFNESSIKNSSRDVQTTSSSTSSMIVQDQASTSTSSSIDFESSSPSSNNSATAIATRGATSSGSATTPLSAMLSSLPRLSSNVTSSAIEANPLVAPPLNIVSSEDTKSQTVTLGAHSSASAVSTTETPLPANQTSILSTSTHPTEAVAAIIHSNSSSLAYRVSDSASLSLVSSSASTSILSSNQFPTSTTTPTLFSNLLSIASSTVFSTSTSSSTNILTSDTQIVIPMTSLSPNNAAAIAGGVAIGEGLALLYAKANGISDQEGLMAAKPELLNSIKTLRFNLDTLRLDLGGSGGPPSCSGSKLRLRRKKRSILSRLVDTITSALCSLTTTQVHLDQDNPNIGVVEGDLEVIGALASELTEEEKQEEEEEEKEKESQSAEKEKASETANSNIESSTSTLKASSTHPSTSASSGSSSSASSVSTSSASSVPASYFGGRIQGDPGDYYEPKAADDAIFAVAGAALLAAMGGSNDTAAAMSGNFTSFTSINATSSMSPTESAAVLLTTSASPFSSYSSGISSSSISTTSTSSFSPQVPDKVNPGMLSSESSQTFHPVETPTSEIGLQLASISRVSISSVSALSASAASASRASSISAVSASIASASRASASMASSISAASASAASAAAVSFPSQISSDHKSSPLCKSLGGNSTCINAYSFYNPLYHYTRYTSYVSKVPGFKGEWLGWGCTAIFECDTDEAYSKGMMGQPILNAFWHLYAVDGVEVCGSIYMDNGCHLKVDACQGCEDSVPCYALEEQYQPPHGGVPCYFENGITWPPNPELPAPGAWEGVG